MGLLCVRHLQYRHKGGNDHLLVPEKVLECLWSLFSLYGNLCLLQFHEGWHQTGSLSDRRHFHLPVNDLLAR